MMVEVAWNGVMETAATKAQQQRLAPAIELQPRRFERGELTSMAIRTLAGADWLTTKEFAGRLRVSLETAGSICSVLCSRGIAEREDPRGRRRSHQSPQRYRLRRSA